MVQQPVVTMRFVQALEQIERHSVDGSHGPILPYAQARRNLFSASQVCREEGVRPSARKNVDRLDTDDIITVT
jgi:hypothetical protein